MRTLMFIGLTVVLGLSGGCGGDSDTDLPEPSCDGVTCSGHGTCAVAGDQAVCTCDTGFAGGDCSACADGFARDESGGCAPLGPCVGNEDCGAHGVCDDRSGQAVCVCDPGWAGAACDACAEGYGDDGAGGCALLPPVCETDSCSGHGACDDAGGVITCTCDPGYEGSACERCADGYEDDGAGGCVPLSGECTTESCSGNGACDDSSGTFVCTCLVGYQGARCDRCAAGYHLTDFGGCDLDITCAMIDPCLIHGTCQDEGGFPYCVCDPGYGGSNCDECAPGYHLDPFTTDCVVDEACPGVDPCEPNGTCDDTGGIITCICQPEYTGNLCLACAPGYVDHGGVCEEAANCQEYQFEHVVYLYELVFAPTDPPCCHDLNGDGEPDNSFGAVLDLMSGFGVDVNATIEQVIQSGEICRLFEFRALDSVVDDPDLSLVFFGCDDLDGDYSDNLSGQEPFTIPESWFEPDGNGGCSPFPTSPFDSAYVAGGSLQAQAAGLSGFPMPLPMDQGGVASITVHGVVADAVLVETADGAQAVSGRLSGGIPLAQWFGAYNAFAEANCACLGLDPSEPLYSWTIDTGASTFVISCADLGGSTCGDVGMEGVCAELGQMCAYAPLFANVADLDQDSDGVNEALSFALLFESVPAVAQGISP